MPAGRAKRVADLIKREIGAILYNDVDLTGWPLVTVTYVELNTDMRFAKIWLSIMGTMEERQKTLGFLHDQVGQMRFALGKRVRLRHIPHLSLALDESLDQVDRIESILKDIHKEKEG